MGRQDLLTLSLDQIISCSLTAQEAIILLERLHCVVKCVKTDNLPLVSFKKLDFSQKNHLKPA